MQLIGEWIHAKQKSLAVVTIVMIALFLTLVMPTALFSQDKKPIRIGVPVPLSGMCAQVGVDNKNGILLAAKHKKLISGRPIESKISKIRTGGLKWV
jgi:ABC-type branched-subunit amino acid transport system substrate-binding protein